MILISGPPSLGRTAEQRRPSPVPDPQDTVGEDRNFSVFDRIMDPEPRISPFHPLRVLCVPQQTSLLASGILKRMPALLPSCTPQFSMRAAHPLGEPYTATGQYLLLLLLHDLSGAAHSQRYRYAP